MEDVEESLDACWHIPSRVRQIGSIDIFQLLSYFPRLCVFGGCTVIFCWLLPLAPGKPGFLFPLIPCSLWCVLVMGHIMPRSAYSLVCTLHHLNIIIVNSSLPSQDAVSHGANSTSRARLHPRSFPFTSRGRVYNSCVRSAMLHASETWAPILCDLHSLQRNYSMSYDSPDVWCRHPNQAS